MSIFTHFLREFAAVFSKSEDTSGKEVGWGQMSHNMLATLSFPSCDLNACYLKDTDVVTNPSAFGGTGGSSNSAAVAVHKEIYQGASDAVVAYHRLKHADGDRYCRAETGRYGDGLTTGSAKMVHLNKTLMGIFTGALTPESRSMLETEAAMLKVPVSGKLSTRQAHTQCVYNVLTGKCVTLVTNVTMDRLHRGHLTSGATSKGKRMETMDKMSNAHHKTKMLEASATFNRYNPIMCANVTVVDSASSEASMLENMFIVEQAIQTAPMSRQFIRLFDMIPSDKDPLSDQGEGHLHYDIFTAQEAGKHDKCLLDFPKQLCQTSVITQSQGVAAMVAEFHVLLELVKQIKECDLSEYTTTLHHDGSVVKLGSIQCKGLIINCISFSNPPSLNITGDLKDCAGLSGESRAPPPPHASVDNGTAVEPAGNLQIRIYVNDLYACDHTYEILDAAQLLAIRESFQIDQVTCFDVLAFNIQLDALGCPLVTNSGRDRQLNLSALWMLLRNGMTAVARDKRDAVDLPSISTSMVTLMTSRPFLLLTQECYKVHYTSSAAMNGATLLKFIYSIGTQSLMDAFEKKNDSLCLLTSNLYNRSRKSDEENSALMRKLSGGSTTSTMTVMSVPKFVSDLGSLIDVFAFFETQATPSAPYSNMVNEQISKVLNADRNTVYFKVSSLPNMRYSEVRFMCKMGRVDSDLKTYKGLTSSGKPIMAGILSPGFDRTRRGHTLYLWIAPRVHLDAVPLAVPLAALMSPDYLGILTVRDYTANIANGTTKKIQNQCVRFHTKETKHGLKQSLKEPRPQSDSPKKVTKPPTEKTSTTSTTSSTFKEKPKASGATIVKSKKRREVDRPPLPTRHEFNSSSQSGKSMDQQNDSSSDEDEIAVNMYSVEIHTGAHADARKYLTTGTELGKTFAKQFCNLLQREGLANRSVSVSNLFLSLESRGMYTALTPDEERSMQQRRKIHWNYLTTYFPSVVDTLKEEPHRYPPEMTASLEPEPYNYIQAMEALLNVIGNIGYQALVSSTVEGIVNGKAPCESTSQLAILMFYALIGGDAALLVTRKHAAVVFWLEGNINRSSNHSFDHTRTKYNQQVTFPPEDLTQCIQTDDLYDDPAQANEDRSEASQKWATYSDVVLFETTTCFDGVAVSGWTSSRDKKKRKTKNAADVHLEVGTKVTYTGQDSNCKTATVTEITHLPSEKITVILEN